MTVRVIKPGISPGEIVYRSTCACTCVFEFHGTDGKTTHDQREGSFITVPCPTCSTPNYVKVRTPTDEARRRQNANVDPY